MKKLFIIVAAALVGMASCAKEGPTSDNNGGEGLLQIKIKNGATGTTRVQSTPAESVVNVLEVWIFESDGVARPATLANYARISDAEFTPTQDGSYGTTLNVANGDNKIVLVIANADLGETATEDLSMEEIMATAATQTFTKANNGDIFEDGFVMAGWDLDVDIDGETAVEIAIDRNVAKIAAPTKTATVTATLTPAEWRELWPEAAADAFDGVPAEGGSMPGFSFTLTGHAVLNGLSESAVGFPYATTPPAGTPKYTYNPAHSYLIPTSITYGNPWNTWDAGEFTYPYAAPNTTWKYQLVAGNGDTEIALARLWSTADDMTEITTVNDANLTAWAPYSGWMALADAAPVYIHESKPGQTTDAGRDYVGYNHDQVIAYIIGGTINATGLTPVTRYWRVNVRDGVEAYHLIRNSIYSVEVSNIASIGHATPWEAENEEEIIDQPGATPTEFVISINEWDNKVVGNTEM